MIGREALTVEELMDLCKMKQSACSQNLRLINSRGLTLVSRQGRWVRYGLGADPKVQHAKPLLKAIVEALRGCKTDEDMDSVIYGLTALTHPRRIALLRAIHEMKVAGITELQICCGISLPALYRHLDKLECRGIVQVGPDGISLRGLKNNLRHSLIALILDGDVSHTL
jgi:DNA-binding transcriptional ArsR family regulator